MYQSFMWRIPRLFAVSALFTFALTACGIGYDPYPIHQERPPLIELAPDPFHNVDPKLPAKILQLETPPAVAVVIQPAPEPVKVSQVPQALAKRFNRPRSEIEQILDETEKRSYADFPKQNDLLAIIAVESKFDKNARYQGCWGLMQIEKSSHRGLLRGRDLSSIAVNIEVGSAILRDNFLKLKKNRRAAFMAYNVGIGAFLKGYGKVSYQASIDKELAYLAKL